MFSKKWYGVAGVLVVLLMTTSLVYAAHTTINTADGLVDSNWGNVPAISADGDDVANDNYDIHQAWIGNVADDSAFYFRVDLVGTGQLPHDYSSFEARLDCNRDGDFQDNIDVVVYYAIRPDSEELVECQGDKYSDCGFSFPDPDGADTNADTFGEEIAGTPYTYEWRADVTNGEVVWSQCLGAIDVQFASLNSSLVVQDTTTWGGYDVTTPVQLNSFTASPTHKLRMTVWGVAAMLALIAGIGLVRRRTQPRAGGG